MAALEIREHTIDSTATVFFFARVYEDDRASAAAYDRARAKIGARDNTSVFRVQTPDGRRQLLFVISGTRANANRASERVTWSGEDYSPTSDEITAIGARLHEVAHANALHSTASWTGVGGLALGPTGSRGTMRRPHG
jgi:hypothetical protein